MAAGRVGSVDPDHRPALDPGTAPGPSHGRGVASVDHDHVGVRRLAARENLEPGRAPLRHFHQAFEQLALDRLQALDHQLEGGCRLGRKASGERFGRRRGGPEDGRCQQSVILALRRRAARRRAGLVRGLRGCIRRVVFHCFGGPLPLRPIGETRCRSARLGPPLVAGRWTTQPAR